MGDREHGTDLGVDLAALLEAGRHDLPELAVAYATLNKKIAGTERGDFDAFTRCPQVGANLGTCPAIDSWTRMRDELRDMLGHAAENADAAGESLVKIANSYADADDVAESKMKLEWKTYVGHIEQDSGQHHADHIPKGVPPVTYE